MVVKEAKVLQGLQSHGVVEVVVVVVVVCSVKQNYVNIVVFDTTYPFQWQLNLNTHLEVSYTPCSRKTNTESKRKSHNKLSEPRVLQSHHCAVFETV